jgi:hypothetical protein
MNDKDIPIPILDNERKMSSKATFKAWGFGSTNKIPVRDVPKGVKVIQINRENAEIEIPTAIKYWWAVPYIAVVPFYFFIALPLTLLIFGGSMSRMWY